jgi:hypothetical protein
MSTKEKLAKALSDEGAPGWMVKNARNGQYDDFESSNPFPITQLVNDCRAAGLIQIAEQAMDGLFDSTKEESDAWYEREGRDVIGDVFGSDSLRKQ